ncbi:MAG: hypothetical protein Q9M94_01280 [Candidatus Gracilibacteria bacterium]|nr:hypothetical protein [Candidatus Gracilibacteria bacterium]MDQ7023526.1 hypothetical protein [Candidatus Gracilibacteria bacterium]
MYNVKLGNNLILKINSFIKGYLNSYLDLFEDSGISNLSEIINNYETLAFTFRNTIFNEINSFFSNDEIFGYKQITLKKFSIFLKVGNYNLKIFYIEDKNQEKFMT